MHFKSFLYGCKIYLVLLMLPFLCLCQSSQRSISVNLELYSNSYSLEEGQEFHAFDSIFVTPALQEGESYLLKDIFLLHKNKLKTSPIAKIKLKAGDISDNKNTFKIGLIDINNNGIFNEQLIDQFFIAPYQSKQTLIDKSNPWIDTLRASNVFKVNDICYKLLAINEDGHSLTIEKPNEKDLSNQSIPINAITNIHTPFYLTNLNGNQTKSTDIFDKKPLYFEYWFNGCSACIKNFDYIKSIGLSEFDLVGINAIDELLVIQSFNKYHGFNFDHYQIDESLMKRIGNLGEYPSAVKYNANGSLVDQFYKFPYKAY